MANKKVLLADDSDTALLMGLLVLKKGAYDVIVARDGEEAVEKVVVEKPDLILMDVAMPRLDGPAAVAQLGAREETRAIRVIMLTSRGEAPEANVLPPGARDVVTKPLDAFELLSKVRGHIGT